MTSSLHRHVWLVTSRPPKCKPGTIRVKCWICFKRASWPAIGTVKTRGDWPK